MVLKGRNSKIKWLYLQHAASTQICAALRGVRLLHLCNNPLGPRRARFKQKTLVLVWWLGFCHPDTIYKSPPFHSAYRGVKFQEGFLWGLSIFKQLGACCSPCSFCSKSPQSTGPHGQQSPNPMLTGWYGDRHRDCLPHYWLSMQSHSLIINNIDTN